MLAIFSDIHLTDESTACNVHATAFNYLGREIESAATREADEVHVVLLGDIFDLVRTNYWFAEGIPPSRRPWGGELDPATGMNRDSGEMERQFSEILERILATNASRSLMAMLNALPAGKRERPCVSYVIGNHDRVFNNFESLKERLKRELPNVDLLFRHAVMEPEYGVLARHGHEWDEICHGWTFANKVLGRRPHISRFDPDTYKVMGIGEAITAELMSGLIYRATQHFPSPTPEDRVFLANLQEINNLRPMLHMFHWLAWFTKGQDQRYEDILAEALRESLRSLLESTLAKEWDRMKNDLIFWSDVIDQLQKLDGLLRLGGGLGPLRTIISTWVTVKSVLGLVIRNDEEDELLKGAAEEIAAIGDNRIQYVVYGHTHEARHNYLSAYHDGRVRMYVNTGTYLPVIERARDGGGYANSHQMTMAFFYSPKEDSSHRGDNGPTLDIWNGIRRKNYVRP